MACSDHASRARRSAALVLAAFVLGVVPGAALGQMQCAGRFVEHGATTAQVLELCGEPQQRVRSERTLSSGLLDSPGSELITIPVEEWTYEEPGQFKRKLIFESGKLVKTESQGFGDLPPMF
jgi:hypothetical protein